MSEFLFDRLHIKVYEEIITGRFNPADPRYSNPDILKGLVEEANTIRIAVLPAGENTGNYIDKQDFTELGYMSVSDFDLDFRPDENGSQEVWIKPLRVYELKEIMDIPYFNSFKCNCFLELMGDEFERIKIRAEKTLEIPHDDKIMKSFAVRHFQKSKKLFYDARRVLREVQLKDNTENIYIIFALNLFLIRTIIFYQKFFKPFIKEKHDSEENLLHELLQELSLKKLCSLFSNESSAYCNFIKKSKSEPACVSESTACESEAGEEKDFSVKKSVVATDGNHPYSPARWNGQINALVNVFTQLTEETMVEGKPILEMHSNDLLNMILTNFRDKHGRELSYYTLRTLLDKRRADKRLHPQSPKIIDVKKTAKGK